MAQTLHGLSENLSRKLIPWVEAETVDLLVMPCSKAEVPASAQVRNSPIRGARQRAKNRRPAGQMSVNTALWPEEGLCAKGEPFLLWVLSGRAQMQIGSQLLCCGERAVILIPPGLAHPDGSRSFAAPEEGAACSILWMRQAGRGLRCWISHSREGRHRRPRAGESFYFPQEQIVSVFSIVCDELQKRRASRMRRHALMLFLLQLERELEAERAFNVTTYSAVRETEEWNQGQHRHPMELACAYIQSHLSDPLTIESVAHIVHMSRATFARQFQEYSGETFLKFVQKLRLEQAQTFLRETDWTVRTISELCGFSSYSSFNNFFAGRAGTTPARYREQARESVKRN